MKSERGNAGNIILIIVLLLIIIPGGYLGALHLGFIETPDALRDMEFLTAVLPEVEEEEIIDSTIEISMEDSLRNQVVENRTQRDIALASVSDLEKQLAEKDRLLQERDDEIAVLRDTINLAQNSNLNNVALIYENMAAEDASDALTILGPEQASLILGAMRERSAAEVLELMDESMVVEITRIMAGFNESGTSQPVSPASPGE